MTKLKKAILWKVPCWKWGHSLLQKANITSSPKTKFGICSFEDLVKRLTSSKWPCHTKNVWCLQALEPNSACRDLVLRPPEGTAHARSPSYTLWRESLLS